MNDLLVFPITDLRDQLNMKRGTHQIYPCCCCEQLITTVLLECRCGSHTGKQSVFERLSAASTSRLAKRHYPRRKDVFSKEEYPEVITNMAEYAPGKHLPAVSDN